MAATIELDRFKLLWLLEGAVGKSHLRWDIYSMFVDDIYPQLSDSEREFIYTYAKRDLSWHFEGRFVDECAYQQWKQMLARFNQANQFRVTSKKKKMSVTSDAYFFDNKYYVGWQRYCDPEYIVNVEQKPYRKCRNSNCGSCDNCMRYCAWNEGDETLHNIGYNCDKCDFIIEITEKENVSAD